MMGGAKPGKRRMDFHLQTSVGCKLITSEGCLNHLKHTRQPTLSCGSPDAFSSMIGCGFIHRTHLALSNRLLQQETPSSGARCISGGLLECGSTNWIVRGQTAQGSMRTKIQLHLCIGVAITPVFGRYVMCLAGTVCWRKCCVAGHVWGQPEQRKVGATVVSLPGVQPFCNSLALHIRQCSLQF